MLSGSIIIYLIELLSSGFHRQYHFSLQFYLYYAFIFLDVKKIHTGTHRSNTFKNERCGFALWLYNNFRNSFCLFVLRQGLTMQSQLTWNLLIWSGLALSMRHSSCLCFQSTWITDDPRPSSNLSLTGGYLSWLQVLPFCYMVSQALACLVEVL